MEPIHLKLRVEAGVDLPGEGVLHLAADVWAPPGLDAGAALTALVCLPGGGMTRRYYDLPVESAPQGSPDEQHVSGRAPAPAPAPTLRGAVSPARDFDASFSFARQMVARGFIVIAIDHLGIGESDRPTDGYALTADVVAAANGNATAQIVAQLREGRLTPALPPLSGLVTLGVGHSMGAMMTLLQQALRRQHAGIALLGFSTRGLPEYLPPQVRELAQDTTAVRAKMQKLARTMFVQPYPVIKPSPQSGAIYSGKGADPRGAAAIKQIADALLPVCAFMSMVPGNVLPEAKRIDVPVFLGLGELDMAGPPHEIPASFPASRDVTLHVIRGAGHSHFLFPSRGELFDRLAAWARTVVAAR
ncbi:MAG: alpha/beta fold hydrolase [Nevskiaceae bacterium]|nr:MAG: alpha/beta fold hydrolase [Nevskiaceae bacterium]